LKKVAIIASLVILVIVVKGSSSPKSGVLSQQDNSGNRGNSYNAPGQSVDNYGRSKKIELIPTPEVSIFESPKPLESGASPTPYPTFEPTPIPPPITTIIQIIPSQPANSYEVPQKIEVRAENQKESVNLVEPGTSLKIEQTNGKFTIRARKADGEEIKLDNEDVINIQSLFLPESVGEVPEIDLVNDRIYILKYKNTIAETFIPLQSLLSEVSANSNYGEKNITFMPNEAVETLVDKKIISGTKDISLVLDEDGEVKAINRKVRLITVDRKLAYEIEGVKKEYFLGFSFLPIDINKKVTISEEDKEVLKVELSLKEKIKDFLSY